jgi:hypothetical protein
MLSTAALSAAHPRGAELSTSDVPTRPVFVDPSGRRHRRVVRTAWLLAGLGAAYVALVVVSLLLPPSLSRLTVPGLGPVLPGPAAAPLGRDEGEQERPEVLLERSPSPAGPAPSPRPTAFRSPSPRPTAAPASPPAAGTTATPAPVPGSTPAQTPTPAPAPATGAPTAAPEPRATAAPSEPPGHSQAPGQASRSPQPRPSPSRGPR